MKVAFLLLFFSSAIFAEALIYSQKRDPLFNPLQYYVNGAFDVTQNPNYFNQKSFVKKHEVLWKRIRTPRTSIKRDGGFTKLWQHEFTSSRVFPNIALHTIGGGYDMLMLKEYFESQNISTTSSTALAFGLSYMVKFGNEALETTSDKINSHDHIADLYFFDALSLPLFLYPKTARFFIEDLGMTHWHFLPVYLPKEEDFTNAGLNYVFRPKILRGEKLAPLFFVGMQTLAGLSFEYQTERMISAAAGINFTDPLEKKGSLVYGLFHETDKRLDASLFLNGSENFRARLNLYPSVLNFSSTSLGFFGAYSKNNELSFGLQAFLPLGVGYVL
jgi:hypothetical protein